MKGMWEQCWDGERRAWWYGAGGIDTPLAGQPAQTVAMPTPPAATSHYTHSYAPQRSETVNTVCLDDMQKKEESAPILGSYDFFAGSGGVSASPPMGRMSGSGAHKVHSSRCKTWRARSRQEHLRLRCHSLP
jgi:hypothetical protein